MVTIKDALEQSQLGRIWLAGGGDGTERDISSVLLEFDIVAVGPGEPGPYREPYIHQDSEAKAVKRFHDEMQKKDVAVLRVGANSIRGVGVVEGDYEYNTAFDDLDGWNVSHVRRCRWLWRGMHKWKGRGLPSQGQTLVRSTRPEVRGWLSDLDFAKGELTRRLAELPEPVGEGPSLEQVGDGLFEGGLGLEYVEDIISNLRRIRRLTTWLDQEGISEYETVAYVVVPVLLSLGWTQQTMAVQWNKIDVVLFSEVPRKSENVYAVVEVKKIGRSLRGAYLQARNYVDRLRLKACKLIVATDGRRWEVHRRDGMNWIPHAYLNVARPLDRYRVVGFDGAVTCLQEMMRVR